MHILVYQPPWLRCHTEQPPLETISENLETMEDIDKAKAAKIKSDANYRKGAFFAKEYHGNVTEAKQDKYGWFRM